MATLDKAAKNQGFSKKTRALNAQSRRIELLTWRQIWADLALPNVLGWQAVVIFLPLGCFAATVYDHNRLTGSDDKWVLVGLAGYLVTVVAIFLLRAYSRVNRIRPSFTIFAGFVLVGIVRGLTVFQVGNSLGIIPAAEVAYRALGGAFFMIWLLVGANVIVTAAERYRDAVEILKSELAYLSGTKTALSRNIESVRMQLQSRINSVLVPAIDQLVGRLKSAMPNSSKNAVADLQTVVETVVRPLSHRVARPNFLVNRAIEVEYAKPNTFIEVLRGNVALGDVILPTFVASATAMAALPSSIITMKMLPAFAVELVGWASVYAFLFFARHFFKDLFMPIWLSAVLSFFLPLLAGSGVIIGGWGRGIGVPEAAGAEFFTLAASLSFVAFWFQVLQLKRAQTLTDLDQVAEEQRQVVSAMRQEIWVLQRHLASTLHGPVQAALFSSIIKFSQESDIKTEQVTELATNLQSAMAQLSSAPGLDGREFHEVWLELCDFWNGVCEIKSNIDETAVNQITDDNQALSCALEVIREAINNAVRHGEANKVRVELTVQARLLKVSICNNGEPLKNDRRDGFGSELISDITHTWQLKQLAENADGFVTELVAEIVLAQEI